MCSALIETCFLSMSAADGDEKKTKKAHSCIPTIRFFLKRILVERWPSVPSSCPYRPRYKQEDTTRVPPTPTPPTIRSTPTCSSPSSNLLFQPYLCASESLMCLFGTLSVFFFFQTMDFHPSDPCLDLRTLDCVSQRF